LNKKPEIGDLIILENGRKLVIGYNPEAELYPYLLIDIETMEVEDEYIDLKYLEVGKKILDKNARYVEIIEVKPFVF